MMGHRHEALNELRVPTRTLGVALTGAGGIAPMSAAG